MYNLIALLPTVHYVATTRGTTIVIVIVIIKGKTASVKITVFQQCPKI